MLLDRAERPWPFCELICFGEAPSAGGALPIFSLVMVPHKMVWGLADETSPIMLLLSLHSAGHLNLKVTITS